MLTERRTVVTSDWLTFAALMLVITGVVNIVEGIVTLVDSERTVVVADRLYVVDVVGWGIVTLVFGAVLAAAGVGVLWWWTWARVVAIVCVALHAVVQVGWLAAYPLWSLLMLGLDVVVLCALAAHWHDTTAARDALSWSTARDPHGAAESRILQEHPRTLA